MIQSISFVTAFDPESSYKDHEKFPWNMVTIQCILSFRAKREILRRTHVPTLKRFLPLVVMTVKSCFLQKTLNSYGIWNGWHLPC